MTDPRPDPTQPLDDTWRGAVVQWVRERAAEDPDRPAVEGPDGDGWTYGELMARVDGLITRLLDAGLEPGEVVAVCGRRDPALVLASLATLEAGGVLTLLDPAHPTPRLERCLRQARPALFITVETGDATAPLAATTEWVPASGRLTLDGDQLRDAGGRLWLTSSMVSAPGGPELTANSPACLTFTSGSAGAPKGVLGRHGPLTHFLPWQRDTFDLGPGDRCSLLSGVSHDPVQRDIFTALCLGATLVVPDADGMLDAAFLARWLAEAGVTVAHLTPPLARFILQGVDGPGPAFPELRVVYLLGDRLSRREAAALQEQAPGARLVSLYGATETQRAVAFHEVRRHDGEDGDVPLGLGVPGAQLLVVDAEDRLVAVGEPGEILVRSPHLAAGYLGDDGLTAARFTPNPLSDEAADRVYRTGDRGVYTPSGDVAFLGRLDHQIKIRGVRVEPREVAAVLEDHPGVRQVEVVPWESADGTALAAYVVADNPAAIHPRSLRQAVARRLPPQMVPAGFIIQTHGLPLTPNGKVDRQALRREAESWKQVNESGSEPEWEQADGSDGDRVEGIIAGVYGDVLGLDRVSTDDDFFDLGGHSLAAARVAVRLRRALDVDLSERDIFEAPTPAELARRIKASTPRSPGPQSPGPPDPESPGSPGSPGPRLPGPPGPHPLSHAQQGLWLMQQLNPRSPAYHLPLSVRVPGHLDAAALERALGRVVDRHHVLRTRYLVRDGSPVQQVQPPREVDLSLVELPMGWRGISEGQAGELQDRLRRDAARPFDLKRDLMLRASVYRLLDEDVLLLTTHHIAFDGWSSRVLLQELSRLYEAELAGAPATLPGLPWQYSDYAAWQRSLPDDDAATARHLSYWRQQLAGMDPLLELPSDRPRPAVQTMAGARVTFRLPDHLRQALEAMARQHETTLFVVTLAAFMSLLHRCTGRTDLAVATPVAGRQRQETEPLIGLFVNTLVMRGRLDGSTTFAELVARLRETTLDALEHQGLPFERLVQELALARSPAHAPLAQIMFGLQSFEPAPLRLGDLPLIPLELGGLSSQYDLSLMLRLDGDGLAGTLDYSTDLFDAATMERLSGQYEVMIESATLGPQQRLGLLRAFTDQELDQILVSPEPLASGDPGALLPLPKQVEGRALEAPDAPAVVFRERVTTHGQLNGAANHLALRLREEGVGRGAFVPVLMERGPALVAALLAVMKTGAAFVPLDPRWPRRRLEQALLKLGCPVVLTARGMAPPPSRVSALEVDLSETSPNGPRVRVQPEDPIYAFFTSGSTGEPKAAVVPHRGIANRLRWMDEELGTASAAAALQTTRHVYDSAVWQLFWPLIHGGKTVLPDDGRELDAAHLCGLIHRHGVTITDFVPSVFNVIAPQVGRSETLRRQLASLRTMVIGGEEINPRTTLAFKRHFPDVRMLNMYGPTECSIGCVCHSITGQEERIPIGRPIANVRALVLNDHGQLCPVGVAGELHLGGACLGLGYLGDEERTREAFVQSPLLGGDTLYRTGDLARWLASGDLEFLGRRDHQIQLRGVRVEPGEIEAALREHPVVEQAVVTVVRHETRGDVLVGHVVLPAGQAEDGEELRSFLRERLPEHMVPAAVVVLEAMPMAPSGKIDREALSPPVFEEAPRTAPRSEAERMVAALWARALGIDAVDVNTNFFDLGGHSLLLATVHGWLCQELGREVPITALFQHTTVAALARHLTGDDDDPGPGGAGRGAARRRGAAAARRRASRRRRDIT